MFKKIERISLGFQVTWMQKAMERGDGLTRDHRHHQLPQIPHHFQMLSKAMYRKGTLKVGKKCLKLGFLNAVKPKKKKQKML